MIGSIGWLDLTLLALMLVPVAAMFASLLLSVSIYARNSLRLPRSFRRLVS